MFGNIDPVNLYIRIKNNSIIDLLIELHVNKNNVDHWLLASSKYC